MSLGCTVLALLALVVTMPLWLIPPLVLVLPPLIWGWLTYRVMSFDALAEHAEPPRSASRCCARTAGRCSAIGVLCGLPRRRAVALWALGRCCSLVAFVVLVPLAIWLYTLVFAFSRALVRALRLAALAAAARASARPPRAARAVRGRAGRCQRAATPMARRHDSFGLIIVGDEILSGKRDDKHLPKVIELLAARGLALAWARYVGDERDAHHRRRCATRSPAATSCSRCGGIGATPDDHTRQCAAAALGVPLALHPRGRGADPRAHAATSAREQGMPYEPDRPDNVHRLNMGVFPAGAEIIPNPYNKIPGFSVRRRALRAGLSGDGAGR